MFVFATCEPEVQGGLLALGLGILALYGAWLWAAVLRGPAEVRGRALVAWALAGIAGALLLWENVAELSWLPIAFGVGCAIGLGVAIVSRGSKPLRLVASGGLGSLTLSAGIITLLLVVIGGGGTCLD